ncbi:MAG: hypothetical protein ACRDG7_16160 [Candidatus Limnocylindria bacterium]
MPDHRLRSVRVGDLLPPSDLGRVRARVLDATAILVPGDGSTDDYLARLASQADTFASWDGRVVVTDPDGGPMHRLAIVDRYGQVYALTDADAADDLPDANALADWFRFLATACPECGVIDDPTLAGPTP